MMPKKEYRWRTYHPNNTRIEFLGSVSAVGDQEAIKKAIFEPKIKDPQTQKRLVALRQG
jgi:hypothetical protein